jgi:hypothetical protein
MTDDAQVITCRHGHAPRPEEEHGSGECYTCLETRYCDCNECIAYTQDKLDGKNADFPITPLWYLNAIKPLIGAKVTKENYAFAMMLAERQCDCEHDDDPAHDETECVAAECSACGVVTCPKNEPLHYHHDKCPACHDGKLEQ